MSRSFRFIHFFFSSQSLLQAHDVVAQEVYGDGAIRVTPAFFGQNTLTSDTNYDNDYGGHNGSGAIDENRVGGDNGVTDNICDVTRIRLVQFQRNTDEPLVNTKKYYRTLVVNYFSFRVSHFV